MSDRFSPGDLVVARGREWVVLPGSEAEILHLRPLSGSEADREVLLPALEREPVRAAQFGIPEAGATARQDAAALLSDAIRLSLRRGAGPFRSAARVGFEPRAYQLVPLLMALRLPVARLLIADDVGIGKTIEAGLVLRELMDRGEVDRFTVLAPPHLVEQWTEELAEKFDLDPIAVTAASAARLERGLPTSLTLFDAYPATVVSLDYIKADRRREAFARVSPRFVIVDEAHTCVGRERGRQQRFELLRRLAGDPERHLLLLTATPHSGDEEAFGRLLALLGPGLGIAALEDEARRIRLARHFVQRRRIDITAREKDESGWGEARVFPHHETKESTYPLGSLNLGFHDAVLDYCLGVVEGAGPEQHRRRLAFWGTLALMRAVGSSPAAALSALRNRLAPDPERLPGQVFDEEDDETEAADLEPSSGIDGGGGEGGKLADLIARAEQLGRSPDSKLEATIRELRPLLTAGARPVVFCRFIATAGHVAVGLRRAFPGLTIEAVSGTLPPEERRARIEAMPKEGAHLLVATDCLSEGINLQERFDAVLHYDLCWNPTRHQQREGRVDRFGQPAPLVRSILLYSPESAIDGAVLEVILRKAERIRKATGVTVPLPEDRSAVSGALMNAVLLRGGRGRQLSLDFGFAADARTIDNRWRDAEEGERRSRARFAQNALKPEEVVPVWQRWQDLLGGPAEVQRFVERAMSRLNAPLEPVRDNLFRAHLAALPDAIRERLAARGLEGSIGLSFEEPAARGAEIVTRTHKLPAILAEALMEAALEADAEALPALGRSGAWPSTAVRTVTTVLLLRLRFKLSVSGLAAEGRRERLLLAEEAAALAFDTSWDEPAVEGAAARALLEHRASGDLAPAARERLLAQARERVRSALPGPIAAYAEARARVLAEDHARVRRAAGVARASVAAVLPVDVMGLTVLVPESP
ncbi:MAG: helicase-related protein [Acetobacteraceae bacterium]